MRTAIVDSRSRASNVVPLVMVAAVVVVVTSILVATAAFATRSGPFKAREIAVTIVPSTPANAVAPVRKGFHASQAWVDATSQSTGISTVAVQAYGDASLRLDHDRPGCHLGWTTLAGIGGVETGHGTTGGAILLPDGMTSHPILGPALNGSGGMAAIHSDAQTTKWHGDPQWDHAVGPMQFIPSTWVRWGADGNGDGIADPNNISDAALTTARYLCASGRDMRTGSGWSSAVFSYNHSNDYVRSVFAWANSYARA
ncbi:MAG: lytic murein transglycosylase [Aeromicrobium sp.]|jgi:membrane-bound lytic murein transglycosylase B|nr:lytic murein transglycosylase [Aeromicrobium sp.]